MLKIPALSALLFLMVGNSNADNLVISLASKHFQYSQLNAHNVPSNGFNEFNIGIGMEIDHFEKLYSSFGTYYNSYYEQSYYAGVGVKVNSMIGFEGGLATGYEGYFEDSRKFQPIGGLVVRYKKLKFLYVPQISETTHAVIGLQAIFKIN